MTVLHTNVFITDHDQTLVLWVWVGQMERLNACPVPLAIGLYPTPINDLYHDGQAR